MVPAPTTKPEMIPLARSLRETGELTARLEALRKLQEECRLCPRNCRARRFVGKTGVCKALAQPIVSSAFPHFGEEPELVGRGGSGTIFLSHCNLRCLFCQNYEISHLGEGRPVTPEQIARMMISLQELGCHNINFVTPTHFVPQLVEAIAIALDLGLSVPIVYNCGGYESLEVLKLLDGIIDIYMPDFKFASPETAKRYTGVADYFEVAKAAIREMHRQVGELQVDTNGLARRGLLIRHLVMPGLVDESKKILEFIAREISQDTYVNIMEQYRPCFKAADFPELRRRITYDEWWTVKDYARQLGLHRGF